jgi:hypothetical protein
MIQMLYYRGTDSWSHYDRDDDYTGRSVRSHPLLRFLALLVACTVTAGWPLITGDSYLGLTLLSLWSLFLIALALARMAGQGGTSAQDGPERPQTVTTGTPRYRGKEPGPRDWTPRGGDSSAGE